MLLICIFPDRSLARAVRDSHPGGLEVDYLAWLRCGFCLRQPVDSEDEARTKYFSN